MAEVLISPTEALDPSGDWDHERYVLDGNNSTHARHRYVAGGVWSGYLILAYPSTYSNGLRLTIWFPTVGAKWQLDILKDEQWVNLISTHSSKGSGAGPTMFLPGLVTAVRIRMDADYYGWRMGGPAQVRLISSCSGPLAPLCGIFHTIGDFFAGLAGAISDVMFVGDALASPFVSLAETFHDAGDTCCQISGALQDLLDAVEGGLTGAEIIALLEEHWPAMAALLADPVVYITEIVSSQIPELPEWLADPVAYITEIVQGLLPELPDFLSDPVAWLTSVIEEHFPTLHSLITDPIGWFLVQLTLAFDLEPYHTQSLEFLAKWILEEYFNTLYQIWLDPEAWIAARVTSAIESLTETLLEALGGLGEQLEKILGLITFPGQWAFDALFGWVDEVQERGEWFMSQEFKASLATSAAEHEADSAFLDSLIATIEDDLWEEEEKDA